MEAINKAAMEANLKAFLGKCRVSKNQPFSHTTKKSTDGPEGWFPGRYYVENDWADQFWIHYCNAVRKGATPTVTERPGGCGPLRADFDFKASLDRGKKRQYTRKILKNIVRFYQNEIRELINPLDFEDKMLWCLVLEKPRPRVEDGIVKDGFHLHFPHFICEDWVQDEYLREKVTTQMIEETIWENCEYLTPVDKFIDTNMAHKPWMMYGSMNYKGKTSKPYLYNRWDAKNKSRYGHAFNSRQREMDIRDVFAEEFSERKKMGGRGSFQYYLPRFLSIQGYHHPTPLNIEASRKHERIQRKKNRRKKAIIKKRSPEEVMADIKIIKDGELMDMLSDDRADERDTWMEVGWVLFNIGEGCEEAMNMWIEFSKRSYKYVEGECEDIWGQMELRGMTIGSLRKMAEKDSPAEYKEWKDTNIRCMIYESLMFKKPNPGAVANVLIRMFGDRFVCADSKNNIWYEFREHRWRETEDANRLRKLMKYELQDQYSEINSTLNQEVGRLEKKIGMISDEDEGDDVANELKKVRRKKSRCWDIIEKFGEPVFYDKVLKMCKIDMYDSQFMDKLNKNNKILTCENGVLDLEAKVFRDGRPDDYSSFTTKLHYHEYSYTDEEAQEFDIFLKKMFPNKKRRDYFLDFMASCLQGGNIHKKFLICTGNPNGGKTATAKLLAAIYGRGNEGYYGKFPQALLVQSTSAVSSSAPREELIHSMGKRIMEAPELTPKEKLNIGFIKMATGSDFNHFRGMYDKKGKDVQPTYTLMMSCNEPPKCPGDDAFWDRARALLHESCFVKPEKLKEVPVPKTFEEQMKAKRFHADLNFESKIPDLAPVGLWRFFERFKNEYAINGLVEPKEVLLPTDNYRADNDIYKAFINEKIRKEEDEGKAKTVFIKRKELCQLFSSWYKNNYPSLIRDKPGENTIRDEITKRLGVQREGKIYGWGQFSRWWGYDLHYEEDENSGSDFSVPNFLGSKQE